MSAIGSQIDSSRLAAPATRTHVALPSVDWLKRYAILLLIVLAGYATLGKGFAYVGYPPLLIGEITLMLGLLVIYRSGCAFAMLATPASFSLAVLTCLVGLQTAFSFGTYGLDAVRDSIIVMYGLYAFIVIALLLERPELHRWMVDWYGSFAWLYGWIGGGLYYVTSTFQAAMPVWPTSGVTVVYVRLGEAAIHIAGAVVFAILNLRKVSVLWGCSAAAAVALITPSRGAMLSCVIPILLACVIGGQIRRLVAPLIVGLAILGIALAVDFDVELSGGRSIGPSQLINNLESIVGTSSASNLDGTKLWRLRWWQAIQDYTFRGPYFWTGKGYGMSLAEADGFVVGKEFGTPLVRVPHNAHLTMLARSGVPGLALWAITGLLWFGMLARSLMLARRHGDDWWANLFIWIGCYALAVVIDASFDVALEGPMVGIWFWCLFGFGIASSMIYRWERAGRLPVMHR
ncbi:MAG TPA: O-antigen ligase family protein [Hyphomicrobiaceae bacterium]|nr:O-antigen ligase family protein [Hyphomicrobiaceae bacterium]